MTANQVAAYAFFNLSAADDPSEHYVASAKANRTKLAKSMSASQIDAGQALTRELAKPGNLLKALDAYTRLPTNEEKQTLAGEGR